MTENAAVLSLEGTTEGSAAVESTRDMQSVIQQIDHANLGVYMVQSKPPHSMENPVVGPFQ